MEPTSHDLARREDLLQVIAAQEATIAEQAAPLAAQETVIAALQGRITALERRLGSSGGTGVPGRKPTQRSKATGKPRKRRAQAFVRRRMVPTRTVTHAPAACPDCGTALRGGRGQWRREVIDRPVAPVRWCTSMRPVGGRTG